MRNHRFFYSGTITYAAGPEFLISFEKLKKKTWKEIYSITFSLATSTSGIV